MLNVNLLNGFRIFKDFLCCFADFCCVIPGKSPKKSLFLLIFKSGEISATMLYKIILRKVTSSVKVFFRHFIARKHSSLDLIGGHQFNKNLVGKINIKLFVKKPPNPPPPPLKKWINKCILRCKSLVFWVILSFSGTNAQSLTDYTSKRNITKITWSNTFKWR